MKSDWCIHYTGIMGRAGEPGPRERRCKAGVLYDSVRQPGSIPCISEGDAVCALRKFPSEEQMTAWQEKLAEHSAELLRRMEAQECIVCGVKIERYVEIRPCVYAEPCKHRQYQGRVPK